MSFVVLRYHLTSQQISTRRQWASQLPTISLFLFSEKLTSCFFLLDLLELNTRPNWEKL